MAPSNRYRNTRRVKGNAWQARVWIPGAADRRGRSLNLGIFSPARHGNSADDAEWAAGRASREFVKAWAGDTSIAAAVADLQRRGIVPAHVEVPVGVAGLTPRAIPTPAPGEPWAGGGPLKFTAAFDAALLDLVCGPPPAGAKRWGTRSIAESLVSRGVVAAVGEDGIRKALQRLEAATGRGRGGSPERWVAGAACDRLRSFYEAHTGEQHGRRDGTAPDREPAAREVGPVPLEIGDPPGAAVPG